MNRFQFLLKAMLATSWGKKIKGSMTENIIEMMMDHICISCSFSFLCPEKITKYTYFAD